LNQSITTFILVAPVLLFAMVAHEYAHGYAVASPCLSAA